MHLCLPSYYGILRLVIHVRICELNLLVGFCIQTFNLDLSSYARRGKLMQKLSLVGI